MNKKLFTIGLLSWAVCHCLAISLLVLPKNYFTPSYYKYVSQYSLPFFPQVWLLFGPQFTGRQRTIEYRCKNKTWSPWLEVMNPLALHYQKNRLSSSGYLYRQLDDLLIKTSYYKNSPSKKLKNLVQILCKRKSIKPNSSQVRINIFLPRKIDQKNKLKFEQTTYPPFKNKT